jgi:hypothetical protein
MRKPQLREMLPDWVQAWRHRDRERRSVRRGNRPARRDAVEPSFGDLVTNRQRWLFATLPPAAAELHWDIFAKDSQKRLARRLGLEVAHDFASGVTLDAAFDRIEELQLDRFVVKPISSFSGIGCRSLVRDHDRFRDLRTGRRWRPGLLKRVLRGELHRARPDAWIVEELLLPVDGALRCIEGYKLYCFGGRVELILDKRAVPGRQKYLAQFHTRDWTPVNVGLEDRAEPIAVVPVHGARIVETAERVASQLSYPFIRIDLYDTSRGILLGEFTPGPGRRYGFDPIWNAHLVRRWREAAAEIEAGIRTGRIVPLGTTSAGAGATARSSHEHGET